MRTPIIAANWKMNKTKSETLEFAGKFTQQIGEVRVTEMAIAPPFTSLDVLGQAVEDTKVKLAAQNVYFEESGAYTGEVSAAMLKELGCVYVIVGHSERRQLFGETDQSVNKKLKAVFESSMAPILCVGENLEQRRAGEMEAVIKRELNEGLKGIEAEQISKMVIAYEPIWAIGTGQTASPEDADAGAKFIRGLISEMYDSGLAQSLRVQYGGSVKPHNVVNIMSMPNVDGALVGGASLDAESFAQIIKKVEEMQE